MRIEQLVGYLDKPEEAFPWLRAMGIEDATRAQRNLLAMAKAGLTLDLLASLCRQLELHLPTVSDADMALNNLERFVAAARSPLSLGSLLERDPQALPDLLRIFSTSQYMSDLLVRDPESYDLLRITEGQPAPKEALVREICAETAALSDERDVMTSLRRFKRRETLRIAYGDIIRRQSIETVTQQISFVADAICEAAVQSARRRLAARKGEPLRTDGRPARFVALALGKLGGVELNYSSDIDLIFLYESSAVADGKRSLSPSEFFERLARDVFRLLNEATELGIAYRVDLRLRPDGSQGAAAISVDSALHYYDVSGRTWERQAFVKARPVAGDLDLGEEFLRQLQPWIYRSYLNRADITGIKALKRRIENRAEREGGDERNVKTGRGGIRDIEFVIQFLQLLYGGEMPLIRGGNTLAAIANLEKGRFLSDQERRILEENYVFLRKIEHRLQIMFDLQTHTLPAQDAELRKLAIRAGYPSGDGCDPLEDFRADYRQKTGLNRKILDHLLHDAFRDDAGAEPEVDLVLDPDPSESTMRQVLGKYSFRDPIAAYHNLNALATEKIHFLSTRRCRHFLASIAPRLLEAIAATPDPDATLVNLAKVSDSLGGKGVLWELFSFSPPTLHLYVRLCAASSYLAGILTSNPGMIDELLDSLLLDRLPSYESLAEELAELCRGAEDIDPILHSFKSAQHLRVGVRDILHKEDVEHTHRALSDVAEVCLQEIARREYQRLVAKYGEPMAADHDGLPCELVVLALGKLGGREPNYHSDLDVIFLYEAEGETRHRRRVGKLETTTNQHFFSQLAQRIIKVVNQLGPYGRLYELDPRLRPTGKNGALAVSLDGLERYFTEGGGQLWERQALCKARPVFGGEAARDKTMRLVRRIILASPWRAADADEIRRMRKRMEETATRRNLKRGPGGTVDIEFAVQMLQLRHAAESPAVLTPGTLGALAALRKAHCISQDDYENFSQSYRFLRRVEAGLRLMNTTARHDLPGDELELARLAYLLGFSGPAELVEQSQHYTRENRRRFERLFDAAAV